MATAPKAPGPAKQDEDARKRAGPDNGPLEETTRESGVDDCNQEYEIVYRRITRGKPPGN